MSKLHFIGFLCVIISISRTNGVPSSSIQKIDSTDGKTVEQTVNSKPILSKKSLQTDTLKPNSELNKDNIVRIGKLIMNSLQSLADDRSAGTFITLTKQAVILKVIQILQIIFYATGSAFFVCSIIDCKSLFGGGAGLSGLTGGGFGGGGGGYGGGGGGLSSIFSRSDFDTYLKHQGRPIVRQIKNAQQLYQ